MGSTINDETKVDAHPKLPAVKTLITLLAGCRRQQ
jgi:hypothetical protein